MTDIEDLRHRLQTAAIMAEGRGRSAMAEALLRLAESLASASTKSQRSRDTAVPMQAYKAKPLFA